MKPSVITVTLNPSVDKTVTVDRLEPEQLNRIREVRTDAGGKGINVAKVLNRFGVSVSAWAVAGGYPGRFIRDKLHAAGITTEFMEVEGETRTNMKVVDLSTNRTTELNEPGIRLDGPVLHAFKDRLAKGLDGVSYMVLAGSLPPGAPTEFYKVLIETASEKGVRTVLDADGEAFRIGLEGKPFAVKPNIHELEAYLGRNLHNDEEVVAAAGQLIAKGISLVQVSMGGDGSILVARDGAFKAVPFPVKPASTVGAGDSMVAAMVHGLLHSLSNEEIARLCSAAGTVTASKPGTEVCTLEEATAKLDAVTLYKLETIV